GDRIVGSLSYASALFDRPTIERHLAQFVQLLAGMAADEQLPIAQLPLLPVDERAQLQRFTTTETAALDQAQCIHHLFEDQMRRTPDAVALLEADVQLSYAVLEAQANQLAHRLSTLGIGAESRVGLYLPRGIDQVVALLAVLKAGAAYLPLDPELPSERLAFLLEDSRPRVVLTCGELRERLQFIGSAMQSVSVLTLDTDAHTDLDDPGAPTVPGLCPDNLAYIIYTSGSTGQPKGTLLTHAGATHYLQWAIDTYHPFPSAVVSSSLAFDATLTSLLAPLLCGARVELLPEHDALDALRHRLCDPTPLGLVKLTPAHLEVIGQQLADHPGPFSPVVMVIGGEALPAATLARWQALAPHTRLINEYGPTETVVGCVVHDTTREDALDPSGRVPIGQPIAHLRIHVLDAHGQLAPIGVSGQLHIAGPQLARGYLGRPDLTAERFVPDPFAEQPGQRMYRSGDLACWRADGSLDFLGRNDDQVKLRGFRIELGEIAAALRACAGVDDAAVVLRENNPGEPRLVAYLVGDAEQLSADRLRTQLAARLPEVMLPTAYVILETLPLTANGKLDRRALPAPDADALAVQAYTPPEGALEQTLAQLWSELLGVEQVGRHDSFFALGGHSLLGVRLISRIRSTLGLELPLAALFAQPRLSELAQALDTAAASTLPAIVPADRSASLPLSFAQQRLWFLDQLDDRASVAYLMPGGVDLHGALNLPALQQALDRIVARHDALRTHFVAADDGAIQRIAAPEIGFALACVDLRQAADPHADAQRHAELETSTPFDLEHGPLIRGRLLRLAEHEHRLLVTMHHIVTDGWSMGLLVRELSILYAAFALGQPDPLPPLPIQYADYALWQRRWLEGPLLQRQLSFWREHLHGAPALLELPTDRPRPALQDYRGDSIEIALDAELTSALRGLSQRHSSTVFMTVLAGWAALLARLSGRDELVIGTPVANRTRSELETLIGFFVNTQALRIDLRAAPSVAELLAQVRRTALAAQDHQDLPFEQVIEALNPARHLGHHPVFQAMLVWQNNADVALDLPGLHSRVLEQGNATAKFDLQLTLQAKDERIAGQLTYATALFERSTIERHLAQFVALLRGMVADDSARVDRLPLLSAHERQQWLQTLAQTQRVFADHACLHSLFEQQVAQAPHAIAVVHDDLALSYADLDARANQLAHHLIAQGIGPEERVALYLERGIDLVMALLAVLKAGAAYLPMDPAYPAERLAFMLDDAQPRLLLAHRALAANLPDDSSIATVLLDDAPVWAQQPTHAPQRTDLLPQHPAYVIYTSGSTGTPKGVVVAHAQVVRLLHATRACVAPTAEDVWTLFHSCAFDFSVWELWGALAHGGRLVVVPQHTARDPVAFHALLCQQRVSVLNQTPSAFQVLLDAQRHSDVQHHLRLVIFGGEALQPATLAPWFAQHGQRTALINMYGITETTVHVTAHALTADDAQRPGHSPIGVPLADLRAYVLASDGQCLPIGVAGELHVAGAGLARGYLGRPGLTAERFVPDPFAERPGERMYCTGDLARWQADGSLEYLGRNDEQVKLRGFRIELGEIQAALRSCNGVRQAAVVAREDSPGEMRLVAYLVGDTEVVLNADALRIQLGARLPEYMLPAAYVQLDALPLTANGKLDRRALPAPDADALAAQAYVAPEGALELLLAALWSELLGVEQVGRHDSFFALGGHSLLAVRLCSRIRKQLGVEVVLADLFAQPQLAALAARVACAHSSALPPIVPVPRTQPLPLSFAQQRLWFLSQLDPAAGLAYLIDVGLRLHGTLRPDALQRALNRIVARHEALRTRFISGDGIPVQHILPACAVALDYHDLSQQPDPEAALREHAQLEASRAFDLAGESLIRGRLLRLAEHEHVLLLTLHHLVADGWSMRILVEELGALYAAFAQGRPDPLAPLALHYADVAAWQRQWIGTDSLQRQRAFWQAHLDGAPAQLALPTDRPRPAIHDYRGASIQVAIDADTTAALKILSARHRTTLFMTVLSAWGVVLARLSNQDQVVIGSPIANRTRSELEPLIGLFVNTQALRIDLRGAPSVAALLAQVRSTALAAQEHQDLPFDHVIEALNPQRSLAYHPVFQAMLAWQEQLDASLDLPELQVRSFELGDASAKFDLQLSLQVQDERIVGQLTYAAALFDRGSIERQLARFMTLLRGMVADDSARVDRLPLLSAPERQQWLQTQRVFADHACLHSLFEQQVAQAPHAIAVVHDDLALGYADLDARANQLAHHLIAQGIGPEDRVALYLQRGIDLIVSLLAVLKSGAAYVPLDPAYPAQRLAFMLDDAQPRLLLAHRALAANLPNESGIATVLLDADAESWAQQLTHAPQRTGLLPQHPAYVIYTSGSTGTPKGVVVAHAQVVRLLHATRACVAPTAEDVWTLFHSCAFDFSVWELWGALAHGGRLVVVPRHTARDPVAFHALLCQQRVSVLNQTPSAFQVLLDAQRHSDVQHHLRLVIFGGEALQPATLAPWFAQHGQRTALINMYGITETTVHVTAHALTADDAQRPGHSPIGMPLADLRVYVLATDGQCLPIGVAGELHVAGAGLARGYLGRPGLTAERFMPDPFAERPGERMYKTG
ncbi:non-ribosomal peptide synthetase, partial [Xanthomonas graminis]